MRLTPQRSRPCSVARAPLKPAGGGKSVSSAGPGALLAFTAEIRARSPDHQARDPRSRSALARGSSWEPCLWRGFLWGAVSPQTSLAVGLARRPGVLRELRAKPAETLPSLWGARHFVFDVAFWWLALPQRLMQNTRFPLEKRERDGFDKLRDSGYAFGYFSSDFLLPLLFFCFFFLLSYSEPEKTDTNGRSQAS